METYEVILTYYVEAPNVEGAIERARKGESPLVKDGLNLVAASCEKIEDQ